SLRHASLVSITACLERSVPAEKAAHHSAEQRKATPTATSASAAPIIAAVAAPSPFGACRMGLSDFVPRVDLWGDFRYEGLVLKLVEIPAGGIAACRLRSPDGRAGLVIELAGNRGIEAKTGQPALHITTLAAIEPDLVLRELVGILGEGRRVDGCQIARHVLV